MIVERPYEKGGLAREPPFALTMPSRSEVEGQARGDRRQGRAADGIVQSVAAAQRVAVTARSETVVRARPLRQIGADDVPACPLVEPIARTDRVHAGRVVEQVGLL